MASKADALAEALAAINPNQVNSQEILDQSESLIDQAVIQLDAKIRKDIETVGQAKSTRRSKKSSPAP